ncbi:GNAT family N-acetyltransferase [Lentzea flaviverrucosa]|uniref:Acetyltransferase (GNAT) family protein n=1 Tax=Lentzea flaviverrucosa TaxID=200379 RepID=A0A1H9ESE7_9PSEU|nr:GNAT family N-acetyltransferase [Lentzea flaviverrucosa]RDI35409.1 acetyltransferase (GNAT) family protein [Lentzea flaviverrucosa]SEQ28535.1 Acetyltransferase (GNAT) family protein [Lentzea flaviverrucosa]
MTRFELFDVHSDDDAAMQELRRLLARCSDASLLARCHGGGSPDAARLYLEALPTRADQLTVAVWTEHGMVGVGSMTFDAGGIEIAVLVEDAWQRHGAGAALAARLGEKAARDGALAVTASVSTTNSAGLALLRKVVPLLALAAPHDGLITAVCPVVTGASR